MPIRLTWMLSMALACGAITPGLRAQAPPAEAPAPAAQPAKKAFVPPKLDEPPPIKEIPLGPMLQTVPFDRRRLPNVIAIPATILPREKSPELDFQDQTAPFTRGETLTGQESKAKAPILDKVEFDKTGTLSLGKVTGAFQNGETITDTKGGSARVRGSLREGIWVLDFAFKPVRMRTVDLGGVRKDIYYLWYRVANHTGKPRMFVPEFNLVTDTGKVHLDQPVPKAVDIIQAREDPSVKLLGVPDIQGYIPVSTKSGLDDVVYGVACWVVDDDIAKADSFKVYVRGLSDSLQVVREPGSGKPVTRYKTLRIDFLRRGDNRDLKESEIELLDPPFEWTYW